MKIIIKIQIDSNSRESKMKSRLFAFERQTFIKYLKFKLNFHESFVNCNFNAKASKILQSSTGKQSTLTN